MAGALAFDLGILVVGAQAADPPKGAAPIPPQAHGSVSLNFQEIKTNGYIDKTSPDYIYIKMDAVTSRQVCEQKSGKVVAVKGIPMCQLPKTAATNVR
ncbi:MAG: hypothetical protein KA220_04970 [Phenylobacterium sp.]|nr:hypothetical protein [Phenylobacterium sp.]MBP8247538.1 hypothetical protein [Phenylobacterium sp.]